MKLQLLANGCASFNIVQSLADRCKKIHAGDEVIQVNHQTVVSIFSVHSRHLNIVPKFYGDSCFCFLARCTQEYSFVTCSYCKCDSSPADTTQRTCCCTSGCCKSLLLVVLGAERSDTMFHSHQRLRQINSANGVRAHKSAAANPDEQFRLRL